MYLQLHIEGSENFDSVEVSVPFLDIPFDSNSSELFTFPVSVMKFTRDGKTERKETEDRQ